MAEIINLREARKARKRAGKDAKAEQNRARFGRTKAETKAQERDRVVKKSEIDGKKLD